MSSQEDCFLSLKGDARRFLLVYGHPNNRDIHSLQSVGDNFTSSVSRPSPILSGDQENKDVSKAYFSIIDL